MEKFKDFSRTPQPGEKVKVYGKPNSINGEVSYGTVSHLEVDTKERKVSDDKIKRIVVLKKTDREFSLSEIDFCLVKKRVRFENQN
jgi:hypothetical protein